MVLIEQYLVVWLILVLVTCSQRKLRADCCSEMSFLQIMAKKCQHALLGHPICQLFLVMKWSLIRRHFWVIFILHILLAVSLSTFAWSCTQSREIYQLNFATLAKDPFTIYENAPEFHYCLMRVSYIVTWVLVTICGLRDVFLLLFKFKDFINEKENLTEMVFIVLCMVFLTSVNLELELATHTGAFTVLLAWVKVTLLIGRFPTFGIYIYMSTYIFLTLIMFFTLYMSTLFGKT